ncbi:MAG: AMP-binding protein, partial [Betaproteobacteria bacterium]|nr:AMP-binding protein [Betaproteobacteria bacterium]
MNLSRIVAHWADQTPGRNAIHFEGADLSYAELWRRIDRATAVLHALGIARGDRVAILAYNCPEILVLLLALARLGAILVPLNWRLTAAEHRLILADCTPKLLFAEAEWRSHAEQLALPVHPLPAL